MTAAFIDSHHTLPARPSLLARVSQAMHRVCLARAEREMARYGYVVRRDQLIDTRTGLQMFPSATEAHRR